jgi:hypothetical protein
MEGRDQQGHGAGLAELEGRLRVLVDEGLLDGHLVGRPGSDHVRDAVVELLEAQGELKVAVGGHDPAGDEGELRPLDGDDPPARVAQAGIEAEDADALSHCCSPPSWPIWSTAIHAING